MLTGFLLTEGSYMDWTRIDPYDSWFTAEEKAEYELSMANKRASEFVPHPDGGMCNPNGMSDACYGCICYGASLVDECNEHVEKLIKHLKENSG